MSSPGGPSYPRSICLNMFLARQRLWLPLFAFAFWLLHSCVLALRGFRCARRSPIWLITAGLPCSPNCGSALSPPVPPGAPPGLDHVSPRVLTTCERPSVCLPKALLETLRESWAKCVPRRRWMPQPSWTKSNRHRQLTRPRPWPADINILIFIALPPPAPP